MTTAVPPKASTPISRAARVLVWLCWLYVLALVILCVLLWTACDAWWPITILAYAPRWLFGLPLAVLVPAVLLLQPRALRLLLLGTVIWLWPLMDLCLPWRLIFAGDTRGPCIRVLTCNIHYRQLDAAALRELLSETNPDIVALQYWSDHAGKGLFDRSTQHIHRDGQFLLASRYPIRSVAGLGQPPFAVRSTLEAPLGPLPIVNLHLATPRDGLIAAIRDRAGGVAELEANIARRRDESAAATEWLHTVHGPLVIVGDFNTTVESRIFRQFWSPYTDAFTAAGFGWGPTQITPRRTAARIDHILVGSGWRCRDCWVGPFVGSEHRPVIADLEWVGGN